MRNAFVDTLFQLARKDQRVVLLTADLGFGVLEEFAGAYPDRFVNVGVAEANAIGIATGLAEAGYIPYVYSIATFASLRPYEQFRNGPISHGLPVRLVGVGGGFEYGHNGLTHYGIEDIGVMRVQPALTTVVPADENQACTALEKTHDLPGPVYFRIGKNPGLVPGLEGRFCIGEVELVLEQGREVLLLGTGAICREVVRAGAQLEDHGIGATVGVVSSFLSGGFPKLAELLGQFSLVVTVESHYMVGALGSFIAEVMAESGGSGRLLRCGISSIPDGRSGSEAYLNEINGISSQAVLRKVREALGK